VARGIYRERYPTFKSVGRSLGAGAASVSIESPAGLSDFPSVLYVSVLNISVDSKVRSSILGDFDNYCDKNYIRGEVS
jgi:hypothetical protein